MIDFLEILQRLSAAEVDFVLVGALAAALQGAQIATVDVDIVHSLTPANLQRLEGVLHSMNARYRTHPTIVPTRDRIDGMGHQLLTTDYGALDLLGAIEGGLDYDSLLPDTVVLKFDDRTLRVLTLEKYLAIRRANPRPRDFSRFPLMEAALRAKEAELRDELIIVYVPRQEDGVLRPVESTVVGDQLARLGPAFDPTERWQFSSGTIVRFETRVIDGESVNVATAQG